ncbi:MAG: alkaline D-peptidase [Solirubrobacterales bacterium]|nr:alkaline D-peptidase [Solirubrobacterales bacterium]
MIARLLALACAAACLTGAGYDAALHDARIAAGARQMSGAVLDHGHVVWTGADGAGAKATDVYALASLTKTYVAALTVRLAERGRLTLESPIGRWLGARIPASARRVTVRELLSHTSGLPDYLDDPRILASLRDPRHHWTEAELLRAVRAPRHRGTFAYSDTDYIVLGAILRRLEHRSVATSLAKAVLAPLGLTGTSLARSARLAGRVAGHHRLANDVWGPLWTDGGIVASAEEVGRFLSALVVEGTIVGPAALADMLGPPGGGYGLGIYRVGLHGEDFWGHAGSYAGWQSDAVSSPATGWTFVVLAHGGGIGGPGRGVGALADVALTSGR